MRTWWILPAVAAAWIGLGCILWRPHHADAGSALRLVQTPARIISMAPDLTEILFAMGLEDNIAGVTQDSDYPPAAAGKRTLGTFWQPDIETVVALKPDLIVALSFEPQRSLAGRLTRMGYRCLMLDIWTVDDLFRAIETLGQVTGRQPQAQQLHSSMNARLASVQNATAGKDRVKVLWVVQRDPLRVAGRNTFINELIELAGGENAIGTTVHKYPAVGGEQVIASAPQVIIEPAMTKGDLSEQRAHAVSYWRRFTTVPAVASGRIYVTDGDLVSRLGPRLCDGVESVAKCLRPEAFGE